MKHRTFQLGWINDKRACLLRPDPKKPGNWIASVRTSKGNTLRSVKANWFKRTLLIIILAAVTGCTNNRTTYAPATQPSMSFPNDGDPEWRWTYDRGTLLNPRHIHPDHADRHDDH